MNREIKFGLITGLLLIVAIGMLVSRYLSARAGPAIETPALNNLGASFRRQLTAPAGTAVIPPALSLHLPRTGSSTTAQPMLTEELPLHPESINLTVTPVGGSSGQAGTVATPVSTKPSTSAVMTSVSQPIPKTSTVSGRQYKVRPGDTLWHIATRFYHRAGRAEMARIIKANPGKLSSAKSMLRVGEEITIPGQSTSGALHLTQMDAYSVGSVPIPGTGSGSANNFGGNGVASRLPRGHAGSTSIGRTVSYKVRPGDTLYRIATHVLGTASHGAITRIMRENNIRSARDLRVGEILHIRKPT